jgi:LPXTG-motif cell wall-anchored protein
MNVEQLLPSLNLMTLIAGLLIAVGAFAFFLRKRRNRAIASHAFSGDETPINERVPPRQTPAE